MSVGNRPSSLQRSEDRREARRHADRDRAGELRHRRRRGGRGRRLRSRDDVSLRERHAPSSTTSSPTRGRARRFARPVRCRASSRSSRRSTSSRSGSASTRSRCATRSTRAAPTIRGRARRERRIGAEKFGWSRGADRRTPTADRSSAASAWRSRSGSRSIHPPTACEVRITGDGSVEAFSARAGHRHRHAHGAGAGGGRGVGLARRGDRRSHRRHALSGGPAVGRQPGHGLADAGCAQRRLSRRARAGRGDWRRCSSVDAGRRSCFADGHVGVPRQAGDVAAVQGRGQEGRNRRASSHRAERRDDYEGYAMHRRREIAVGKHGIGGVQFAEVSVDTETGSRQGAADRRGARLRPADQSRS